ncbi:MAG: hypothetical protein ACI382_01610 [Alloprevotella sp.]
MKKSDEKGVTFVDEGALRSEDGAETWVVMMKKAPFFTTFLDIFQTWTSVADKVGGLSVRNPAHWQQMS